MENRGQKMVKIEDYVDCASVSELNFQVQSSEKMKLNLMGMGFSSDLVEKAIKEYGVENIDLLLETLFTLSAIKSSETESTNSLSDASLVDGIINSAIDESLSTVEELKGTTIHASFKSVSNQLLEMGFSEEEISLAIDNFGPETPICELADSILAKRIAYDVEDIPLRTNQQSSKDITESRLQGNASAVSAGELKRTGQDADLHDPENFGKVRKGKFLSKPEEFSYCKHSREACTYKPKEHSVEMSNWSNIPNNTAESALSQTITTPRCIVTKKGGRYPSEPPYLLYGNVINISTESWQKLSRFLFGIEPEYVNSESFSAMTRKEGFLHNLPTENRVFRIHGSSMTIQDALPFTTKNWPSWDNRKKLHGISSDGEDVGQCCERLGKIMMDSLGILSQEQKAEILHQCKTLNLLWASEHSLIALAPTDAELILGYPCQHTQVAGLEDKERLKALMHSFQTDLLGYLLSPLKPLYPQGLRVLSVFSGIGGAEIALSKLGIPLKCVISIETSEINRQILKKWWDRSGQSGYLGQVRTIRELSRERIRSLIEDFGGFDLVIAGNPYNFDKLRGYSSLGVNFTLYFEYVRLFQIVRGIMSQKK